MPVIETYFLDTNILVKCCEYLIAKKEGGNTNKLEPYYVYLQRLLKKGHRLVINRISILEMYFLYHRWFYYDKKRKERAPFDEIFGKEATYELEDQERDKIVDLMGNFIQETKNMGIEFSTIDQGDVVELAEILYKGSKPSVEAYNLSIYANSILECSKCLVTSDGDLCKAIHYLRQHYAEKVRTEIINRFGERYHYWVKKHDLPNAERPKTKD